jgi:signal transduction histidine kinase
MATIAAPVAGADTGVARPPRAAVAWAIAIAGFAAAACAVALAYASGRPDPNVQAALNVWIMLPYVLAGVAAWWRRPESRLGPLMIAAGFAIFLSMIGSWDLALPDTIGSLFDLVPAAIFMHVYLAFPSGHLEQPVERLLVATTYAVAVGLQLAKIMVGAWGQENLLALTSRPELAKWLSYTQLTSISVCCLVAIGVLAARRRRAGRPLRRSVALLVDSFAVALLMMAALFLVGAYGWPGFEPIREVTYFSIGLAPVAFLVGLLDARLARSAVGDLFLELRADPAPADLRDALARTLRDDSLELAYWLPEFGTYADLDGRAVDLPTGDPGRATTLIDRDDDTRVAALLHSPALRDEPELLDSVAAAAAISLENARLHAELRARLEELRGSRARIVEAGQKERQRLERNLHDGAQQRLVALSLELSLLESQLAADPAATQRLASARREIAASLEELRELARGLHPAVVSGHGLDVALEQLAARAPVPVKLRIETQGRLPEPLEVAAFYLVSESLANVGKYARATSASVDVTRNDGRVVVEVIDDGCGGADTERGSGLRGLADRVEALDGRLLVWSPQGGGTRVRAELPCAS